ncbi:MAG: tetratricopeptide repeat protein, partial [Chloroflexota bacterium]
DIAALPGFYYARSVAYYRQDLYPEALSDQLAAIELGRVSAADYEYLGDIYFFSGDNINAISAYETAITLDATNPWLYYYLGDIYEADGNFDQATINYGQAISLDSEEVTFVEAMANLKWDEGNYDLAIVGFQEAIRINPTDPWLHNSLGDVYYDADDDQAAEASYLMATQLDPTVSLFFENLGLSLRVQEKYGDALIAYSNSLEIDPDGGFSWFGRGATYYLMGMDPEAIADLQKAKEYDIGQDLLELVDELLAEMGA